LNSLCNKESGLLGISGISNDMRNLAAQARNGERRAALAIDMFCYRVRKYIGAYHFAISGARALVFTGGIGENAREVRRLVLAGWDELGLILDPEANHRTVDGRSGFISAPHSKVKVLVIPTDEERMIARQSYQLVV
jgi:acetate kinase